MKSNLKMAALAIGISAWAFTGCQKEMTIQNPAGTDQSESQIQSLAVQTQNESQAQDVNVDYTTGVFTANNEGVAPDYLIETGDLAVAHGGAGASLHRMNIVNQSFLRCLVRLHLDSTQMKQIRVALRDYQDCKATTLGRARDIQSALKAKYQALAQIQLTLFQNNEITRAELQARLDLLRQAYAKEMREKQMNERVHSAMRDCHEKALRALHAILTDAQWDAFIACYKR